MIVAVPARDAMKWAKRLEWHLDEFTKGGDTTARRLLADVATKDRQLWVYDDGEIKAAVLTRIADDDLQTCVVTHAAGKDRQTWQHLWPALEHWAKEIGCKRIEAVARAGWERVLKPHGMKKTHVILERRF